MLLQCHDNWDAASVSRRKKRIRHSYAGKGATRSLPNDDIRRQAASSLCLRECEANVSLGFCSCDCEANLSPSSACSRGVLPYPIAARVMAIRRSLDNAFHGKGGGYRLAV